jgi:stage II sporulation protein GA (sporulation sigma-E factor processing peptidase)
VILLIVYVDVLIVLNTLVNYFILLGVRKITRAHTVRWRIALGALSAGFSSLLIFFDDYGVLMTLFKILSAVVTIVITFGIRPYKQFLKRLFLLFAITFIFGGFVLAVYIFFDKDIMIYSNGIVYFDVSMTFLIICSVISYLIITIISKILDKKAPVGKEYITTIQNKGLNITCTALMDTGNNLRDPFSGYPVIMVDKSVFNQLFNEEKIRLIPVSTVSGDSLIRAFKPENVSVNNFSTNKVYIGESNTELQEYKVILNISLEGEIHNE